MGNEVWNLEERLLGLIDFIWQVHVYVSEFNTWRGLGY